MEERLEQLLYTHLVQYHPDLLMTLQGETNVSAYIRTKTAAVKNVWTPLRAEQVPDPFIEDECMRLLTADLWPSRYQYLSEVLEDDFTEASERWRETGLRTYEIVNLIAFCEPVFENMAFSEATQHDRMLRYAIIGSIQEYLQGN